MYYLLTLFSAALFSVQFIFNEKFRQEMGDSWNSALKFTLYTSITGFFLLFVTNNFQFKITLFAFIVAIIYSIVCILLSFSSIKAFSYANLSMYSMYSMIGGMLLPFAYGIYLGEKLSSAQFVACFLILVSVFLSVHSGKRNKNAVKYYVAVFFLNGMVGVLSKFHQINVDVNVDSGSFMMLTKIVSVLLSYLLIISTKNKDISINKKAFYLSTGYSMLNSFANLILLIALCFIPASLQYTLVTGGTIIFSVILSVALKQKNAVTDYISAVVAFGATLLMLF